MEWNSVKQVVNREYSDRFVSPSRKNVGLTSTSGNPRSWVESPSAKEGNPDADPAALTQLFSNFQQDPLGEESTVSRTSKKARLKIHGMEMEQIFGQGLVCGQVIMIGGEPGIGKSSLVLQICHAIGKTHRVLYVSGEETVDQITIRALRMFEKPAEGLFLLNEANVDQLIESVINSANSNSPIPDLIVIDSIQTLYSDESSSAPGGVSQIRLSAVKLLRLAKSYNIAMMITGHVTKSGDLAGPRMFEHLVDTVLYLEGDRLSSHRILRCLKNRFGSSTEAIVFDLEDKGLREIANPTSFFLSKDHATMSSSGLCIGCTMEGSRPILVEIQALVTPHLTDNPPRHRGIGVDNDRLMMILAVLQKVAGVNPYRYNVFVNVVGGMSLKGNQVSDLAIAIAVMSSLSNVPIPQGTIALGEIGLTGEIRPVHYLSRIVNESERLGFQICLLPKSSELMKQSEKMEIYQFKLLIDAITKLKLNFKEQNAVASSGQY